MHRIATLGSHSTHNHGWKSMKKIIVLYAFFYIMQIMGSSLSLVLCYFFINFEQYVLQITCSPFFIMCKVVHAS